MALLFMTISLFYNFLYITNGRFRLMKARKCILNIDVPYKIFFSMFDFVFLYFFCSFRCFTLPSTGFSPIVGTRG